MPTGQDVDFYNGKVLTIEGIIVETDVRRDRVKYTVKVEQYFPPEGADDHPRLRVENIHGDLLISLPKYPRYDYGDRLRISGELKDPGTIDTFSYHDYLSRFDIYSVMYRPQVTLLASGQGSVFWQGLYAIKNSFLSRLNRIFPEPQASFEAGLLVGERQGIPPDILEKFNNAGLTHIIAISGYNITIIIAIVMALLRSLPRRIAFYIAILTLVLFTLFVGAGPSVVRAALMGILGLIALYYGRQNTIQITVFFTAAFMTLWNPKILWFDVGFQLSFLAVLGLIYVAPVFQRYLDRIPHFLGIKEAVTMTLAAQVMSLPILIYNFDRLSLIAPVANLFAAFAIPLAMFFGFLAVLLSFLLPGLALVSGFIAYGFLTYIITLVEFFGSLPYASFHVTGVSGGMVVLYYGLLIWFLIWYKKRYAEISVP